jgi:hypothetical protein
MKLWLKLVLIGIGISIFFIVGLLVLTLVFKIWWGWFIILLIFLFICWGAIGIVKIVLIFTRKKPSVEKISLNDAKQRAIYEMKYDDNNPDNFKIDDSYPVKIGEKGKPKTPVAILEGKGTENNERRVVIINLNNPKKEISSLINPTDEKMAKCVALIAEYPAEESITEEIITQLGQHGIPETRIKRRIPNVSENEQKEKEEAEKANAM